MKFRWDKHQIVPTRHECCYLLLQLCYIDMHVLPNRCTFRTTCLRSHLATRVGKGTEITLDGASYFTFMEELAHCQLQLSLEVSLYDLWGVSAASASSPKSHARGRHWLFYLYIASSSVVVELPVLLLFPVRNTCTEIDPVFHNTQAFFTNPGVEFLPHSLSYRKLHLCCGLSYHGSDPLSATIKETCCIWNPARTLQNSLIQNKLDSCNSGFVRPQ